MGSQRVGHDVVTEQQKQVSTQLFKSKKGKPSCRFLPSSICFLWKVCHLCPFERSCLDGRSSLLYPKGTQWGGSTVGREHGGEGAPWRVLCGEDAPWGGSLVEREPCGGCSVGRELRGEGAPWGGCSMGRELGGGGTSVGRVLRGGGGQAAAHPSSPGCPPEQGGSEGSWPGCETGRGLDPSPATRTRVDRFTSCSSALLGKLKA